MQTPPVLKARLVHAEPGQRVVQVSAWQGTSCLGSALGEAASAEAAEERAVARLQERLGARPPVPTADEASSVVQAPVRHPVIRPAAAPTEVSAQSEAPGPPPQPSLFSAPQPEPSPRLEATAPAVPDEPAPAVAPPPHEPPADPDDWSDELAELDVQLQRIGWDRNHEGQYLQRAFGHPSRNRLTAYADLVSYLRCLRNLPSGSEAGSAPVPLRRKDLLEQCDQLLRSLQWDASRGRQLLEQQFQLSSRQQLSDEQLLQFNMLLEEALLDAAQAG